MEAKIADQDRYIEELASKLKYRKLECMKHECNELDREIDRVLKRKKYQEVSQPFVQC